jgi:hypothetical protein
MTEVVLSKDAGFSVDLDANEMALLDEIDIVQAPPKSIPIRKPPPQYRPQMRPSAPPPAFDPSMDAFMNPTKRMAPQARPEMAEEWDGGQMAPDDEFPGGDDDPMMNQGGPNPDGPSEGYTSIEDEKADLLNKLARLEKKGFKTSGKLTAYSDIGQIRTEFKRIMYQIETDQSVKFARRIMIACVTGVEFLNKRYDPFDIELDGWSENMMENIDDYDSVFEELHTKYKNKVAVAPEIKLMMMVGGSAMMFHLTKSMFKSAGLDTGKVLKQNPELLKSMMEAVQNSQSGQQTAAPPRDEGGRREMKGPNFDMSSLMGGFMAPPPPMNSRPVVRETAPSISDVDDDMSDIISVTSDTKNVKIKPDRKRRTKKKEVTL